MRDLRQRFGYDVTQCGEKCLRRRLGPDLAPPAAVGAFVMPPGGEPPVGVVRPCTHVGPGGPCPEYATSKGRCDEHQRQAWSTTTTSRHARGYDSRWTKVRNAYVNAHPTCEHPGCDQPTDEVDHVVPLARGGARLDPSNLQGLCTPHHAEKTARDRWTPPTRG